MKIGHLQAAMDQNIEVIICTNRSSCSEDKPVSELRQFLSQAIATGVNSLLFLSLGMMLGFPALLIPVFKALSGPDEASWYGAVTYICQPLGAIISGSCLQSVGCKKLMILINIPLLACWMLAYFSTSTVGLHVANACAGATIGLIEAPAIRYISEISHPSLRGMFTTWSSVSASLGILLVFFLGSLTDWRNVALISSSVPIVCALLLVQVPETPMWLMSKGRPNAAMHSLQWLRGWAPAEMVRDEFEKIEFYAKKKTIKILHACRRDTAAKDKDSSPTNEETEGGDPNPNGDPIKNGKPRVSFQIEECEKRTFAEKWEDLSRREMVVPLCKCFGLFSLMCLSGVMPMRPYLVQIFSDLRLPLRAHWTTVWVALLAIVGNVCCLSVIRRVRKKPLLFFSFASSALCLVIMARAIRSLMLTPAQGESTFFQRSSTLILFMGLFFCHGAGVNPITFIYLGEILPYRGRGVATGIVVSFFYVTTFAAVKLFATMEVHLGLHAVLLFFAAINVVGIFYTYFFLPETEGKYLSDIEIEIGRRNSTARS